MIWETVVLALRAIRRNVLRSFLTILGIVIGVAAVITMVTLGDGATEQVRADISSLGSNMLQIRPGQGFRGPGGVRIAAERFKIADVHAIEREIYGLEAVAPISDQAAQAIYGNRNWATSVMGSTNDYLAVRDWQLSEGRVFTEGELHSGRAVCILGSTVVRELFGDQDPLGAFIRLDRLSCQVVGVLASKGQSSFGQDQDDMVLVPLKTLQRRIMGSTDVEAVMVSASDGVSTQAVREDIERLMRERRKIAPDKDDDFHVRDMQEIVSTLTSTTRVLTALLGAVAAVSLLVGGIGIMNIMLASVTERTREIGIRRALGAKKRDIIVQFLIETVILAGTGGAIGVLFGVTIPILISHLAEMKTIITPWAPALAFSISAMIGVVFGIYPALRAANMDPVEALRHE